MASPRTTRIFTLIAIGLFAVSLMVYAVSGGLCRLLSPGGTRSGLSAYGGEFRVAYTWIQGKHTDLYYGVIWPYNGLQGYKQDVPRVTKDGKLILPEGSKRGFPSSGKIAVVGIDGSVKFVDREDRYFTERIEPVRGVGILGFRACRRRMQVYSNLDVTAIRDAENIPAALRDIIER